MSSFRSSHDRLDLSVIADLQRNKERLERILTHFYACEKFWADEEDHNWCFFYARKADYVGADIRKLQWMITDADYTKPQLSLFYTCRCNKSNTTRA